MDQTNFVDKIFSRVLVNTVFENVFIDFTLTGTQTNISNRSAVAKLDKNTLESVRIRRK